jgi:hypothetical protein
MAQTLKFGNGTWATKKGSTLAYNDEDGNFKPLPFTYTGAGKGTRVNKEGLIEVVENDRPRIDYKDSEDGVFLLEKAATNLVTYSEDFSQWSKVNGVVVTDNFTTSPDGTQNASKLVFDGTNLGRLELAVSASGTNTQSVYLKTESGTQNVSIGAGSSDLTEHTITDQWVRYTHTGAGNYPRILCNDATTIYAWGCQYESGNLSSYIPTQGSASTRVAETANGSGNSEVFNSEQGVLFADILPSTFTDVAPNFYKFISLSDGTSTNRLLLGITSASKLSITMVTSGGNTAFTEKTISQQNLKVAINWDANYLTAYLNGFKFSTPLSVVSNFAANSLKSLNFNTPTSYPFYGKTKEIAYYDEVLTDLELETLTSYRTWEAMVKELNLNIIHNE